MYFEYFGKLLEILETKGFPEQKEKEVFPKARPWVWKFCQAVAGLQKRNLVVMEAHSAALMRRLSDAKKQRNEETPTVWCNARYRTLYIYYM